MVVSPRAEDDTLEDGPGCILVLPMEVVVVSTPAKLTATPTYAGPATRTRGNLAVPTLPTFQYFALSPFHEIIMNKIS